MSSIADAVRTLYRPNSVVIEGGDAVARVREASIVRKAGAQHVIFGKDNSIAPAGATAFYNQPPQEVTPHRLVALVPISEYILKDPSNPDEFIESDAGEIIGLREDLAFLRGTGQGGEPVGLMNMAAIRILNLRKGELTKPRGVLDLLDHAWKFTKEGMTEEELDAARWAAFLPWDTYTAIETEHKIGADDADTDGVLPNGLPFYGTNQIGSGHVLISNMAECVTADSDRLEVSISSDSSYTPDGHTWISAFQANQVLTRVVWYHDLAHRRPGQVIALRESAE